MKKLLNKYIPILYGFYFNSLSIFSKKKAAKKAFDLFCTPRKGKVLQHQKDYLESAKSETFIIDDILYQTYHWPGKKDTVLLLHGWESNSFRWRNLILFLKKAEFDIIAIDAPAHGNSSGKFFTAPLYVDGIAPLIEKRKPKSIIAHSIGGMSALYYQKNFPDSSIEKIVTLGSPSEFSVISKEYRKLLGLNNKVTTQMDKHFFYKFGFRMNDFSTAEFAKKFTIKGLLIHDEFDKITSFKGSEKVHANWKGSNFIKTNGFGHSLHQDEVSEQVVIFLKS